ncbi:metal ABC transporter substrate-binding protein [Microbacterium sp. zg.Y1090]|uniref:metal ABC transporter substrate-binding protein n=1 Tax=Microbacterium wangruii TaxID=3049073 RepID=UPI00214D78F1|nr:MULTISPECIES: metal ABC transporter substrate-binding protein [unclassified Microbacterium]MCR2819527.1 metal ABC transporter substrate-binding protein [Microbacterium sp. zg.Y1090]WIM28498.1 metal ABC transporter substrate-binding protein [Microbacterium sp. zg-Y1090]
MPKTPRGPIPALLAIVTASALALTGCSEASTARDDDRPVVVTTFTVLQDIAQNVAGEHLRVESITKIGAEIHGYEPTPGDVARAGEADLLLDNGLGLEAWFEQFIADLDVPRVVVSEGVDTIAIGEDAYAGRDNPHAWMSPLNAQVYVDNLVAAFTELDPDNAAAFQSNGAAYKRQLQALHDELTAVLDTLPSEHRALVTCEGAFSYLARDAGLTEHYIWPVNAEQQATPRRIAATIDAVRDTGIPAVFCESTVSDAAMQRVVEATDAVFGGVLYVDSLSDPDGPVPTYLDLLRHDAAVIAAGLAGTEQQ